MTRATLPLLCSGLVLAALPSPSFSQDEERPREKKIPEIHGSWVSSDGEQVRIIRGDEGEQTFKLLLTAEVLIDGMPGKIEDIPKRTAVILEMVDGNEKVALVRTVGPREGGEVTAVDVPRSAITVTRKKGNPVTYKVLPHARIEIDGKAKTFADLSAGFQAGWELSLNRKSVISITLRSGDKGEEERASRRRGITVRGPFVRASDDSLTLLTGEDPKEQVFAVPTTAKIVLDGKPAKLIDLKPSAEVEVRFSEDQKITHISQKSNKKVGNDKKED